MCGGNGAAPMLDFITRLTKALNAGKRRGYSEPQETNGETCWIQFAIKKENGLYVTYFYSIEEKYMAVAEDHDQECIEIFEDLESALRNLKLRGAELEKLTGIQCALPF
jgi:hypothetical protein